ncbi:DUF4148 domain-containing protein [Pandoraea anhela]|uniref:DUF4148 domain-containing protein n=1 Tax=Pandoraea anhela TaxID=2508295 RepID=A0A5E4VZK5_9BURK|nr:DUF4148 domain-containing protein [Pandoraea anhela]VVE17591.1 hypothetical protein PAN31108_02953 [Pandoraea anhela]
MKKNLLTAVALVSLTVAAGSAMAADQSVGVTREHVRAELQAARELGLSPVTEFNFPYTLAQSVQLQKRTAEIEAAQRSAAPQAPMAN